MLLESSGCGAMLHLDQIPCPPQVRLERWLICFPSYGFLLSVRPEKVSVVQTNFQQQGLVCEVVGKIQSTPQLILQSYQDSGAMSHLKSLVFWDLAQRPLTGFAKTTNVRPY
jgi:uncharacterized protein